MTLNCKDIELFRDLTQLESDGVFYDFHNDFNCVKMIFENSSLLFVFKHISDNTEISINFQQTDIKNLEFSFKEGQGLTLDSLYRGRSEANGKLHDFDYNGKCYFYLEFYESQKMEFVSEILKIELFRNHSTN